MATYQRLINRGWRRSGCFLYRPNLIRSCCKLYTIILDADKFKADKKHRQTLNKFNRFVLGPDWDQRVDAISGDQTETTAAADGTAPKKVDYPRLVPISDNPHRSPAFDLQKTVHLAELENLPDSLKPHHEFTLRTEPASFTAEKFELYKAYQIAVHGEKEHEVSSEGFTRFLCQSPLHPELFCGSFHQLYFLDSKLIAFAVLDVLPGCISSVYFVYDPQYSSLGLGKISALRETAWAKELGVNYYMGYYIPTCPKMKYKGEYQPSYIVDPATPNWEEHDDWLIKFDTMKARWKQIETESGEKDYYVSFIQPGSSISPKEKVTDIFQSSMPGILEKKLFLFSYEKLLVLDDTVVMYSYDSANWRRREARNRAKIDELTSTMSQYIVAYCVFVVKTGLVGVTGGEAEEEE